MNQFEDWTHYKQQLHMRDNVPIFHVREIWWCALGKNIGHEQDGKNEFFERPVLVLQKFNKDICIVIPITSAMKEGRYYYKLNNSNSSLILSQVRLISSKRLLRLVGTLNRSDFHLVKERVKNIL